MQSRKLFHAVQPFMSALAVIATAIILVFTIYFTELGPQWIMFLTGVLVAAILAEATRRSHAEWVVKRRTAQLSSIKAKLERESHLRKTAEKAVAAGKPRLHLIDEILPTMVAFVDREGRCQYHNRAFLDGLHLRPEQTDGRHMRDVLGAKVYRETATAVRQSLDGQAAHYERTQKMPDGSLCRLSVEHLPQFGEDGKVGGFYMLINDITEPVDVSMPDQLESSADQDLFVDSYSEQVIAQHDGNLIRRAIENGEFSLFCQLITPLSVGSGGTGHYEILVRLMEEEEGMIPPGMFFPLAEKHGLMTHLDRWVVQHVTEWIARQNPQGGEKENSVFFINVSGATIADPGFPQFLQLTLLEYGVPGSALCFEIPDSELASRSTDVAEFARQVRQCGCRVALSGFGRDRVLFDLIRGFQVEFLKIDGSIILDILHDPVKLAKVTAINRVAKKIGVKTIAEMVESEDTIASLKKIGIDFAQGFGISRPRPLKE
jgi:PAS domain S-box-containing protein